MGTGRGTKAQTCLLALKAFEMRITKLKFQAKSRSLEGPLNHSNSKSNALYLLECLQQAVAINWVSRSSSRGTGSGRYWLYGSAGATVPCLFVESYSSLKET